MQKLFFIFLEQLAEVFVLIFLLFKHFYLQFTIETNWFFWDKLDFYTTETTTHGIHPTLICIPPPTNKLNVSFAFVLKDRLCIPHQGDCLNMEFTRGKFLSTVKLLHWALKSFAKICSLSEENSIRFNSLLTLNSDPSLVCTSSWCQKVCGSNTWRDCRRQRPIMLCLWVC